MSSHALPLGLLLVAAAGCRATGEEAAPEPAPEATRSVTVEVPPAPAASTADEPAPAPAMAPDPGPGYHPDARRLLERMERGMRPLESIPSLPGQGAAPPPQDASASTPQTLV